MGVSANIISVANIYQTIIYLYLNLINWRALISCSTYFLSFVNLFYKHSIH